MSIVKQMNFPGRAEHGRAGTKTNLENSIVDHDAGYDLSFAPPHPINSGPRWELQYECVCGAQIVQCFGNTGTGCIAGGWVHVGTRSHYCDPKTMQQTGQQKGADNDRQVSNG